MFYYYRTDRKGNPIEGSNFKSKTLITKNRVVRIEPLKNLCCSPEDFPNFPKDRWNFYVKVDDNKLPIASTLRKFKGFPTQGYWQRVANNVCCGCQDEIPVLTSLIEDNLINEEGASISLSLGDDFTVSGDNITFSFSTDLERVDFEIVQSPEGEFTITFDEEVTVEFEVVITATNCAGSDSININVSLNED